MLELEGINYLAVVVVWFVNMVVGSFWYSPAGFAKQWEAHTKINLQKMDQHEATRIISFVALSALIQAFTLDILFNSIGVENVREGLSLGLLLWFGLVTATAVGVTLYAKRSWGFLWLNSSYFLVVMLINSVILSVWH